MNRLIITLAAISMLMACTGGQTSNGNDRNSIVDDNRLKYTIDSVSYVKNDTLDRSCPTTSPHYNINHKYEFLVGEGIVIDSINASICQHVILGKQRNTDIAAQARKRGDEQAKKFEREQKEMYNPSENTLYDILFFESTECGRFLTENKDGILSYETTGYIYQGGTHGGTSISYLNFNRKTGHLITLNEVLDLAYEKEILAMLEKKLIEDFECTSLEELKENTGFLTLGDLYLGENFLLTPTEIVFHYGQYEIAPYASGMCDISLPYSKLKKYLLEF